MGAAMNPTQVANFRFQTASQASKSLNFKQVTCQGTCKTRRSVGQFNHHPAICDRCYNRMPKTA